jgi:hypothetical protein
MRGASGVAPAALSLDISAPLRPPAHMRLRIGGRG